MIVAAAISLWRRHLSVQLTVDILCTFCGVFMVQCVQLMLRLFEFGFSLLECFVYRQNVADLKHFNFAVEVEGIIISRFAVVVLLF